MRISDWSSDVCSSDLDECGRTDDRLRHLRPAKTAAVIRDHRRGQRLRLARARVEVPSSRATMCNAGVNLGQADYVTHMLAFLRPGTLPPPCMFAVVHPCTNGTRMDVVEGQRWGERGE